MRRFSPPPVVVWILAAVLLAGGAAYVGRGLWIPWERDRDIDLKLRNDEHAIFLQRIYPHALVAAQDGHPGLTNYTIYPPYAFAVFTPLFAPPGYRADRALYHALSIAALVLMAWYGARELRFAGPAAAALGAALPLAFSVNYVALCQGQFSIICTGLIIAQLLLLEKKRPAAAGLCWALAMLKPQIAAAFALLFFIGGRGNIRGLIVGAASLFLLSAAALIWTGTTPDNLVINGLLSHRIGHMAEQSNAAGVWMGVLGLTPIQATLFIAGAMSLAAGAAWFFLPRLTAHLSLEITAAICAAIGYAGFYHVHYDNMMLFPLLLALVAAGFRSQSLGLLAVAAVLALISYAEPATIVGLANSSAALRWGIFAWPLIAGVVLILATRPRHGA